MQLDHENLSLAQLHFAGLSHFQAVEEYIRSHVAEVSFFFNGLDVVLKHLRIDSVADSFSVCSLRPRSSLRCFFMASKSSGRSSSPRPACYGRFALKYEFLQLFRESSMRLAHHSLKVETIESGSRCPCLFHICFQASDHSEP